MAIEYIEGDLIASDEEVIIHGCNIKGKFGKGFAKVVKENHPVATKAYDDQFQDGGLILGSVIWSFDKKLIGHAIIQPTYGRLGTGRHISYEAFKSALLCVKDAAENGVPGTIYRDGFTRVSMPLIGSALGGGDWRELEKIIEKTLPNLPVFVYVLPGNKPSVKELANKPSN